MYWRIVVEDVKAPVDEDSARQDGPSSVASGDGSGQADGRFVLHRHCDEWGPHLDLRLEQDGYLLGWRIDGVTLSGEPWATEKAPHPVWWLEQDSDAVREDAGIYAWLERGPDGGSLLLEGRNGARRLRVEREPGLHAGTVRSICEALSECGADADQVKQLILDGVTARRRAMTRLCGLGRELDGGAFDEEVSRKVLVPLSLEEIHAQLRAYEVRFDHKYPPAPVSRCEKLDDLAVEHETGNARTRRAFSIVRE